MSKVRVALLTGSKLPTLGAFILHSGCSLDIYDDLDEFLVKAVSTEFQIIFCDETFLKDENNEDRLLRFIQRSTISKFFLLSERVGYYRIDSRGAFHPDDLSSIKKVITKELEELGVNDLSNTSSDEIVIEIEEETEEEKRSLDVLYEAQNLKKCQNLDDLGKALIKNVNAAIPGKRALVFKYLPNYCSLVVLSGTGSKSISKYNGMGLNFSSAKDFNPKIHLNSVSGVPAFKKIVSQAFHNAEYETFAISVDGVARLIMAVEVKKTEPSYSQIKLLSFLAEEKANHIVIKSQYHKVKIHDELTGFLTKEKFFERMQDEYTRAQRIFLPVSVVVLEIDKFIEIKDNYNLQRVNTLLKMISKIFSENVRHNDYIGRLSDSRFGLLFPHMSYENAIKKVDKLRSAISQTKFFSDMQNDLSMTTSSSLLTYPKFSHTADEGLVALENSLDRNTFTDTTIELSPREGFRPDFVEIELPFSSFKSTKAKKREGEIVLEEPQEQKISIDLDD